PTFSPVALIPTVARLSKCLHSAHLNEPFFKGRDWVCPRRALNCRYNQGWLIKRNSKGEEAGRLHQGPIGGAVSGDTIARLIGRDPIQAMSSSWDLVLSRTARPVHNSSCSAFHR